MATAQGTARAQTFVRRTQPYARVQQGKILAEEYQAMVRTPNGWAAALAAFQGLKGDSRLALNEWHYSIMIQACAKGAQWEKAIDLFAQMRDKRLKPNTHTFTHLINACAAAETVEMAERAYGAMLAHRVRPNSYIATALIAAQTRHGHWERALQVLAHAETLPYDLRANGFSYNAAIDACRKGEKWDMAVHLLQRMRHRGQQQTEYSFHAVLGALGDAKQWEPALRVFQWMRRAGLGPTPQAREALARACDGAPPEVLAATERPVSAVAAAAAAGAVPAKEA